MSPTANRAFADVLVASLADLGLRDVCVSPGSRNTPLSLAVAAHSGIDVWVHHDERSSGFFAIGLARAASRPVALVCTSGTAATEYFPAVIEAGLSRVPLIVITADRPPELRDVGAPQAIDQIKLYGDKVKWFHQGAPPDDVAVRTAPQLVAHAWGAACDVPAGPVHLNLPFREPLVDAPAALDHVRATPTVRPHRAAPTGDDVAALAGNLDGRNSLFVVGTVAPHAASAIAQLAERTGAVVFADPQSGLRAGSPAHVPIAHADLLAGAGALDRYAPELVVRWGALPTSKATWRWLEANPSVPQILVDAASHRDPTSSVRHVLRHDPGEVAGAVVTAAPAAPEWIESWRQLAVDAARAVDEVLADEPFPNEPQIASTVFAALPPDAALFAGSSMPIRDVDAFAIPRPDPLHIVANRGANGIDGSVSTAAGVAAAGMPTAALIGDVAALHDLGALAMVRRVALPLTVVVVHNDGGGIFGLLPQADPNVVDPNTYELVFGTPHGTDFVAVAAALGLEAETVTERDRLAELVANPGAGPRLIQLHTDRHRIAPLRQKVNAAIKAALPNT